MTLVPFGTASRRKPALKLLQGSAAGAMQQDISLCCVRLKWSFLVELSLKPFFAGTHGSEVLLLAREELWCFKAANIIISESWRAGTLHSKGFTQALFKGHGGQRAGCPAHVSGSANSSIGSISSCICYLASHTQRV